MFGQAQQDHSADGWSAAGRRAEVTVAGVGAALDWASRAGAGSSCNRLILRRLSSLDKPEASKEGPHAG
jgi:hypothetical protein